MSDVDSITVLFPDQGESLSSFEKEISDAKGEILVIFSDLELALAKDKDLLKQAISTCKQYSSRLRIATHNAAISQAARAQGIRVVSQAADLKKLLAGHEALDDALREFQPHIWRQQLRNRLQSMGLLSLPKLRIWLLIIVSGLLLFFVVFHLLPSATVTVWPREDNISQTANIFLVQSGSTADIPSRVRTMELIPVTVRVDKTITFHQMSKEFIGQNATTILQVRNDTDDTYWLKEGTRFQNQAGMIFTNAKPIRVDPQDYTNIRAIAEPKDIYGEIIGERGNVPEGLRWHIPGLSRSEQQVVYAHNLEPGRGGVTRYQTILSKEDIEIAEEQLRQELLSEAKGIVVEKQDLLNIENEGTAFELLHYDELTHIDFVDIVPPTQFLNLPVQSAPIEGSIVYTMYAYDTAQVLSMLSKELRQHVGQDRRLMENTLDLTRLVAHVIDYEDELSWIKLTVDLSGTEQYILDPLSPTGAVFAKKVRESITGLRTEDANRIVSNFPEVKKADVSVWPPWQKVLPGIASSIAIEAVVE